jgi:hypothetical protein
MLFRYAPSLQPYIEGQVDADRNRRGQFILTGSQNLLLMQQVTESLARRAATLKLMPMSKREIEGAAVQPLVSQPEQDACLLYGNRSLRQGLNLRLQTRF